MRASELIDKLEALQLEHGDLEVVNEADEPLSDPEYNDDLDARVFVLG